MLLEGGIKEENCSRKHRGVERREGVGVASTADEWCICIWVLLLHVSRSESPTFF